MKVSFRKAVIWVAVVVVVLVLISSLQNLSKGERFTYQIETIANKCTFDVSPVQEINVIENSIVITMPIQTPTPCYDVKGTVSSQGNDIVIDLKTKRVGDICVECVGVVTARVTISNLSDGTYNLQVKTPDKSIIKTVNVE
jgi:hypothetical protein